MARTHFYHPFPHLALENLGAIFPGISVNIMILLRSYIFFIWRAKASKIKKIQKAKSILK